MVSNQFHATKETIEILKKFKLLRKGFSKKQWNMMADDVIKQLDKTPLQKYTKPLKRSRRNFLEFFDKFQVINNIINRINVRGTSRWLSSIRHSFRTLPKVNPFCVSSVNNISKATSVCRFIIEPVYKSKNNQALSRVEQPE